MRGQQAQPIVAGRRHCNGPCQRWRPVVDYPVKRNRHNPLKFFYQGVCTFCKRLRERAKYRQNPEAKREASRRYREENYDEVLERERRRKSDPAYLARQRVRRRRQYREEHPVPRKAGRLRDTDHEEYLRRRRERHAERMANDPEYRRNRLEYNRIYQEAKRREKGAKRRDKMIERRDIGKAPRLDAAPFVDWLESFLIPAIESELEPSWRAHGASFDAIANGQSAHSRLEEITGIDRDWFYDLRRGKIQTVDQDRAERLLKHFGGPEIWEMYPGL